MTLNRKDFITSETKTTKKLDKIKQDTMLKAIEAMKIKQDKNMPNSNHDWKALTSSHTIINPYPTTSKISIYPEPPIIIGKAVGDCKAGKLCMIESSVWVNKKTKKPRTEFRIVYKDVRENELLYDCETKEINSLCHDFMQIVKEFKLTPRKLADMLEQKKNTEIIINN